PALRRSGHAITARASSPHGPRRHQPLRRFRGQRLELEPPQGLHRPVGNERAQRHRMRSSLVRPVRINGSRVRGSLRATAGRLAGVFKDAHARHYLTRERTGLLRMLRETFWPPRAHDLETSEQSLTIDEMLMVLRDCEREPEFPEGKRPAEAESFRKRLYVLI